MYLRINRILGVDQLSYSEILDFIIVICNRGKLVAFLRKLTKICQAPSLPI